MSQAALARIHNRRLEVEDNSRSTSVPNDDVARLMYYLHCISTILDDCVPSELTDYSHYYRLNNTQRLMVIRLACELTPDKVPVFVEMPSLPENNSNMFLKFSSLDETVTALGIQSNGAAMMALRRSIGNKQELVQVMAYTPRWLQNNYLGPLMNIRRSMQQADSSCCTVL